MAARDACGRFPMDENAPPTYTFPASSASEPTELLAPGFQKRAKPLTGSSAARRLRDWPPIRVNKPPAYTLFVPRAMVRTKLSAPGFHGDGAPVTRSRAAI